MLDAPKKQEMIRVQRSSLKRPSAGEHFKTAAANIFASCVGKSHRGVLDGSPEESKTQKDKHLLLPQGERAQS